MYELAWDKIYYADHVNQVCLSKSFNSKDVENFARTAKTISDVYIALTR